MACRVKLGREPRGEGIASSKSQRWQGFWPRGLQEFPCGPWSLGGWLGESCVSLGGDGSGCLCLSWGRTMARLVLVEGTGHRPDCSQLLDPCGAPPSPNPQACHVEPLRFFSSSSSPTSGLFHSLFPWWECPFHAGHLPVKGRDAHESPQGETEAPGSRVHSSPGPCVPADLAEGDKASALALNPPAAHGCISGFLAKMGSQSLPCWPLCPVAQSV